MGNICTSCSDPPVDFEGPVDISHFTIGRVIGKGSFGKVCIVTHKKTKKEYALKYINKAVCSAKGLAKNMIGERKLLEEAKSPFICNLRYAFQDDLHLLMVIDLNVGGDIAFHLKFGGVFPEDRVKFYFAEITCGLSYLHSLKIVHRDIKPGNILLNESGHASLSDFNLACHYKEERPMTSRSGTLKYMAPEILAQKGYLNAIDWWSLGIMTYEMLFGTTPFSSSSEREIKRAIMNDPIRMPDSPESLEKVSADARDLVLSLLNRDVSQRLGSIESGGSMSVRTHKWFQDWDWTKVQKQEILVPFIPDIKRCTYYNRVLNLDEILFDEAPLQSRPVKRNRSTRTNGSSKTSTIGTSRGTLPSVTESEAETQMRVFEEEFIDYDWNQKNNVIKPKNLIYIDTLDGSSIKTTSVTDSYDQKHTTSLIPTENKLSVIELDGIRKRSLMIYDGSPNIIVRGNTINQKERARKAMSLNDATLKVRMIDNNVSLKPKVRTPSTTEENQRTQYAQEEFSIPKTLTFNPHGITSPV